GGGVVGRARGPPVRPGQKRVSRTRSGGHKDDPLYAARRTLHTRADLLTEKQKARLAALFAVDEHVEVEVTWWIYQRMIAAYREPDREKGRDLMSKLIDSVSHGALAASARSPHWAGLSESALPTCSPTSTGPAHPTAPPRRSTAGPNTCGAPPSDSATSPTTSPDPCSRPAASDPTTPSTLESRVMCPPPASTRARYRRAALVAIWRRSKLTARGDPATTTGCAAPDRPVLRAPRMAPPHASSRAERRILAHCRRSALVTNCDPIPGP